jgi:hypothetical protein
MLRWLKMKIQAHYSALQLLLALYVDSIDGRGCSTSGGKWKISHHEAKADRAEARSQNRWPYPSLLAFGRG